MSFYNSELTSYLKMDSSSPEALKLKESKRKELVIEIREELDEKSKDLSYQELETRILTKSYSEALQSAISHLEGFKDRIHKCESALARIEADRNSS